MSKPVNFIKAYEKTLLKEIPNKEHPYVNDPDDPGGETKWGITEKLARQYKYTGNMKDLSIEEAESIAYLAFWMNMNLDEIDSQYVAEKVFDLAFSKGLITAGKIFQSGINMLLPKEYERIEEDGIVGPLTLKAYRKIQCKTALLKLIKYYEIERILEIVNKNPKLRKYLNGWLNRV